MNSCGHHHVGHVGMLGVDKDGSEWYQISIGGSQGHDAVLGDVIGPSFAADEVPGVIGKLIDTYVEHRHEDERFIDTVRRIGMSRRSRQRVYGENTSAKRKWQMDVEGDSRNAGDRHRSSLTTLADRTLPVRDRAEVKKQAGKVVLFKLTGEQAATDEEDGCRRHPGRKGDRAAQRVARTAGTNWLPRLAAGQLGVWLDSFEEPVETLVAKRRSDINVLAVIAVFNFPKLHRRPRLFGRPRCCASRYGFKQRVARNRRRAARSALLLQALRFRRLQDCAPTATCRGRAGQPSLTDFRALSGRVIDQNRAVRCSGASSAAPPKRSLRETKKDHEHRPNLQDPRPATRSIIDEVARIKREALAALLKTMLHAIAEEHGAVTFANSFGAEDMVLTDLILAEKLPIEIFSLDTGRLPAETYTLMGEVEQHYGTRLKLYFPDATAVENMCAARGSTRSTTVLSCRKQCCAIRKVAPLKRALAGKSAWITGMRAAQSATRTELPVRQFDEANGLAKYNPLADWSEAGGLGLHPHPWPALQRPARPVLPQHRLCPMHTGDCSGRRRARWPLVVGRSRQQRVRASQEVTGDS
jgi:phosphoadenosine phosphosulfate reductase